MIREHVGLAQELAGWVAADDRFEIVAPAPARTSSACALRAGDEATDALALPPTPAARPCSRGRSPTAGRSCASASAGAPPSAATSRRGGRCFSRWPATLRVDQRHRRPCTAPASSTGEPIPARQRRGPREAALPSAIRTTTSESCRTSRAWISSAWMALRATPCAGRRAPPSSRARRRPSPRVQLEAGRPEQLAGLGPGHHEVQLRTLPAALRGAVDPVDRVRGPVRGGHVGEALDGFVLAGVEDPRDVLGAGAAAACRDPPR